MLQLCTSAAQVERLEKLLSRKTSTGDQRRGGAFGGGKVRLGVSLYSRDLGSRVSVCDLSQWRKSGSMALSMEK